MTDCKDCIHSDNLNGWDKSCPNCEAFRPLGNFIPRGCLVVKDEKPGRMQDIWGFQSVKLASNAMDSGCLFVWNSRKGSHEPGSKR